MADFYWRLTTRDRFRRTLFELRDDDEPGGVVLGVAADGDGLTLHDLLYGLADRLAFADDFHLDPRTFQFSDLDRAWVAHLERARCA